MVFDYQQSIDDFNTGFHFVIFAEDNQFEQAKADLLRELVVVEANVCESLAKCFLLIPVAHYDREEVRIDQVGDSFFRDLNMGL